MLKFVINILIQQKKYLFKKIFDIKYIFNNFKKIKIKNGFKVCKQNNKIIYY